MNDQQPSPDDATQIDLTPEIGAQLSLQARITYDLVKHFFANSRPELELIEQSGEGSSGIVVRALDKRLGRTVAIKVLHRDWASKLGEDSLAKEAQAAALSSDHVVRVYEISPAASSISYIIMEWIDGPSLRSLLEQQSALAPEVTAKLVRQIALGLESAHRNGIVHGDIKPANVMLEPTNGASATETLSYRAKLADFGLARRIESKTSTEHRSSSANDRDSNELRGFAGTPAYASPEQLLSGAQASFASDIWSLGATLYHLLCGAPPYPGRPMAIVGRMREAEPTSPRKLDSRIPRDLESICLKSLSRNPSQRYSSAQEFAQDLQRFLEGIPVSARPISTLKKSIRLIRRKPLISGLAIGLTAALLSGTFISNYFRLRAEENLDIADQSLKRANEQRDRAVAVTNLLKGMISASDTHRGDPNVKVIDALSGLESRLTSELRGKPDVEADVRSNLGSMYFSIAAYQQAYDQLKRAIELRGDQDRSSAQLFDKVELANCLRWLFQTDAALRLAQEAYEQSLASLGQSDPTTVYALETLAGCHKDLQNYDVARDLFLKILDPQNLDARQISALSGLASVLLDSGKYAEAEKILRQVIELREKFGLHDNREKLVVLSNLGTALSEQGKVAEAIEQERLTATEARKILGTTHDITVTAWLNYAETLRRSGDSQAALAINREFLEICRKDLGPTNPRTIDTTEAVAMSLVRQKQCEPALELVDNLLKEMEGGVIISDDQRTRILNCRCSALMGLGRASQAIPIYASILEKFGDKLDATGSLSITLRNNYGLALIEVGRAEEAAKIYKQIIEVATASGPTMISRVLNRNYGLALIRSGRPQEGKSLLEEVRQASLNQGELDNVKKCDEYLQQISP